ncbi:MAG: hypothetical protein WCE52_09825 [Candidatus Acidiferrum sp.]
MRGFEARRAPQPGEAAVSIKVRVTSGCFHREHSPRAYQLIDTGLTPTDDLFAFEEHESGPEILVYLAVATAGLSLAKSVVDLITAIIKARSEGIKKGDHPSDPLELIVRRVHDAQEFREETVLRIGHEDPLDENKLQQQLENALRKLLKDQPPTRTPRKKR